MRLPKELEEPLSHYLKKVGLKFSEYVRNLIREDLIEKGLIKIREGGLEGGF